MVSVLILVVKMFDRTHKKYLGTWNFAKTWTFLMGLCLFKVNNRNNKTRCEICSKIKIPERLQWHRSGIFVINSENISQLVFCCYRWLCKCKCPLGCFTKSVNEFETSGKVSDNVSGEMFSQNFEILGWCPVGSVLPHGEEVPL